ncbi:MAG TPA: glucose 1-dehydrogenase [Acidobacteriaceae bacterium]|jgi:3-oxoacyl-[acyl-carrier protein] reductase|nr:glucose 1-dehydrogenase [Acidobacteriaceae bacterium]
MAKLTGKVAVVTGASKGIGAGIAKALAAQGAAVVVNYASDKAGADRVVSEITGKGGKAVAVGANVASTAEIDKLFAETTKAFGKLDVLVNNAGVYAFAPIDQVSEEEIDRIFNTNVKGLLLTTKAAVALFPKEGGSVINIGSVVSEITPPASSVYTGTKGAVDAITRVLAKELGPRNIRVNAVNPGLTITEGTHTAGIANSDFEADSVSKTPLGRSGKPEDIADVVAFIASEDARWVTGALLQAGGGLR